jgi:hypothetical protein
MKRPVFFAIPLLRTGALSHWQRLSVFQESEHFDTQFVSKTDYEFPVNTVFQ